MGPPKRKGTTRRQVLDLNSREESPSRPTWQTKYQQILTRDGIQQNGDSQPGSSEMISSTTSSSKSNPLSGLVGNYNSDSDSEENTQQSTNLDSKVEDFLKEIQSISTEPTNHVPKVQTAAYPSQSQAETSTTPYPATVTAWQQCIDQNSGYPYYWNTETNEVTWEMPAEVKAALATVVVKQQPQQAHQAQQPKPPEKQETKKKPVVKYPWQTESDSEDEKIEMITSFGGEESDEDDKNKKKGNKGKKGGKEGQAIGPQLPIGPLLPPSRPPARPPALRSSLVSSHDDSEVVNESGYETSGLLTHCIPDTGPPGDESFPNPKETVSSSQVVTKIVDNEVPDSSAKEEESKCDIKNTNENSNSNHSTEEVSILSRLKSKAENFEKTEKEVPVEAKAVLSSLEPEKKILADDVIAQIENELPPDYASTSKSEPDTKAISGGMALVANYGDDSESEENQSTEKRKPPKPLFPIVDPEKKISPLFPCVEPEPKKPFNFYENHNREDVSNESESKSYAGDPSLPDSTTTHKAFKRKKRIEFATTNYGPSSSKASEKPASPEPSGSSGPVIQYNMDPSSNEHRGFGFSAIERSADTDKKKNFKGYGGIQFIKAETINLNENSEGNDKTEGTEDVPQNKSNIKEKIPDEEIENAASLLKEKVTFLTEGKDEISPVQIMAIQLETLVLAWQQGSLTPTYLSRWLNEKCGELNRHEKSAAPPGWTCLWDRKNKRYFYRNTATKAIQWEYPNVDERGKDVEGGGEEMDLCDTPPHLSPEAEKATEEQPLTPPPPIISDNADSSPPSPTPPPPPQISFCKDEKGSGKHGKKKKKTEEVSSSSEGDLDSGSVIIPTSHLTSEKKTAVPPLPPMPPPPPPPPEEPPPPLPESPPPLPIDPDQPLPPGVDEPELALYRRHSPKHSFKKTQPDSSSAFPPEVMMTYGYGLAVQPVVSSSSQGLAIPMHEYHNYVHDAVSSNHFVIQTAPPAIHCPAKKPKLSLNSELDSFYSDIAMLDGGPNEPESGTSPSSQEPAISVAAQPPPPPVVAPTPSTSGVSSPAAVVKNLESTNFNQPKKKKKTKLAPGLSMKKKGVSSLVAKWQQVQQEVRRDYNSDEDDDDVSSTHK